MDPGSLGQSMNAATPPISIRLPQAQLSARTTGRDESGDRRAGSRAHELVDSVVAEREQVHVLGFTRPWRLLSKTGVAVSSRSAKLPNDWLMA